MAYCKRTLFYRLALLVFTAQGLVLGAQQTPYGPGNKAPFGSNDSTPSKPAKRIAPLWQSFQDMAMGKDTFYPADTSFAFVQRYNRAIKQALPYTDLGVNATPLKILVIDPAIQPGFQTGFNPFPLQNKDPEKILFYKAAVPFTRFNYIQGSNGLFVLDAMHTQNIAPGWNISLDFSSAQNGEVYTGSRQSNLHRGTMLGNNFRNRKGNYSNTVVFSWNRARRNENFGLQAGRDSFFFHDLGANYSYTPAYYPYNSTASSIYGANHHLMLQKLFLGKKKTLYFFHQIDWKKERYKYTETSRSPDSAFYGKSYYFTKQNFADSTAWEQWLNQIGVGNAVNRNSVFPLLWKLFYSTDRIVYNSIYKTAKNIYYNQGLHAAAEWDPLFKNNINLSGIADYYFSGINNGDYKIAGEGKFVTKNIFIGASVLSQAYAAPFYTNMFTSNYRQYIHNFDKVKVNSIGGKIKFKTRYCNLYANLNTGNADNFIYVDKTANFAQISGLRYATLTGGLNLHWRKLFLDNKFTFQSNNKMEYVPVPKYSDIASLYYEGNLFKKAMYARIGIDVWIMGKYNGYSYNPEIAAFYPTTVQTGNHPVADIFFSGRVQTVELFLKFEHVNARYTNYGFNDIYYSGVGYPMEPFRFRFGLNWKFYN